MAVAQTEMAAFLLPVAEAVTGDIVARVLAADAERERFREALLEIEQTKHTCCYNCGPCIAHRALYGHFPTWQRRCCWKATP